MTANLDLFRNFLEGWKEAILDDLTWGFPTREEFEECNEIQCEQSTWEIFMLKMLDEGLVGMDGFRYCWPEVAKENRRKLLASEEYRWGEAGIRARCSA